MPVLRPSVPARPHRLAGLLALGGVALTVGLAACTVESSPVTVSTEGIDTAAPQEPTEGSDGQSEAPAPPAAGTRENPVPVGGSAQFADWAVQLGATDTDATAEVAATNTFNEPPPSGRVFIMVPVTVQRLAADAAMPWLELSVEFVGNAGRTYGSGMDDYCGVVPDPFSDIADLYEGASETGNVCVSVPTAEVPGGTWRVAPQLSLDGSESFFALG